METLNGFLIIQDDTIDTVLQIRTRIFQSCDIKRRVDCGIEFPTVRKSALSPSSVCSKMSWFFRKMVGEALTFRRSVIPQCSGCSLTTLNMETIRSCKMLHPYTTLDGVMSQHIGISIITVLRILCLLQRYIFAF
jgi:hypothetical protein